MERDIVTVVLRNPLQTRQDGRIVGYDLESIICLRTLELRFDEALKTADERLDGSGRTKPYSNTSPIF